MCDIDRGRERNRACSTYTLSARQKHYYAQGKGVSSDDTQDTAAAIDSAPPPTSKTLFSNICFGEGG